MCSVFRLSAFCVKRNRFCVGGNAPFFRPATNKMPTAKDAGIPAFSVRESVERKPCAERSLPFHFC